MKANGFYDQPAYKGRDKAIASLTFTPTSANTRGIRLGGFPQIRKEISDAMEGIFFGKLTVQAGPRSGCRTWQRHPSPLRKDLCRPRIKLILSWQWPGACERIRAIAFLASEEEARPVDLMNKRAVFKSRWLPIAFALPQLLLIFFFFYWPATSVLTWAFSLEPAFGGVGERLFVGWDNFREVFADT